MIRIREYRKRMGLTMKELGAMVGVSESCVGLWENGRRKPSYEKMLKVAEILDCGIADLLGADTDGHSRIDGGSPEEYIPEITMIARAGQKMSPERRKDMLQLLKIAFPEEFNL